MEPIRIHNQAGTLTVRDGISLTFFARRPIGEIAASVDRVWKLYQDYVGQEKLCWCFGPSSETAKKATPRAVAQFEKMLQPEHADEQDVFFRVLGPEKINPDYMFEVEGFADIDTDDEDDLKTNRIQIRFPTEDTLGEHTDRFVSLSCQIAGLLAFDSGYATPALFCSSDSALTHAAGTMAALAVRHPGYDLETNDMTIYNLGKACRGARWLTFLGSNLVQELGGKETMAAKLDPAIELIDINSALLIRAGAEPQVGDVNREDRLPILFSVAQLLEPITFFDDEDLAEQFFEEDEDAASDWERRFLTKVS